MRINHTDFIIFWEKKSNYGIIKENFRHIFGNKLLTEV